MEAGSRARPDPNRPCHAAPKPAVLLLAAAVTALLSASAAEALEHFMAIQEAFPGTPAAPNAQYVMLRMTSPGQTLVMFEYISVEDAGGVMLGRFGSFDHDVLNGGAACVYPGCPAILIGTSEAQSLLGFAFDQIVDAEAGRVALPESGGRVCFRLSTGTAADCVAYGAFSAANTIPMPTVNGCDANFGAPAAALAPGYALTRTAFNCASKENSTQFTNLFPHPVANNGANANSDPDGDGLINVLDCGDADAASWYAPVQIRNTTVDDSAAPTIALTWDSQNATVGPSTRYDVVTGDGQDLADTGAFTLAMCLERGVNGTSTTDPSGGPPPGRASYYAARARNGCSAGTFGDSLLSPDPRDFLDDRVNGPCQ